MINTHHTWTSVPHNHKTKKQWLKVHRRVNKCARPVGTITLIFDKPRKKPKYVEAISPEECQAIREKLQCSGPDASTRYDLYRLDRTGQLAVCNLYDCQDTVEITAFRQAEAQQLLEYMVWDNSHEDDFITEKTVDGERQRRTWKSEISMPDLADHLTGERYFGVKKGHQTMQITVDCDRHRGNVSGEETIDKVIKVGEVLKSSFPQYRFAPEINNKNGSVKFFGWLPKFTAMPMAERLGEQLHQVLRRKLPEYNFDGLEIFPSNSPQIFAPLRADKTMVIVNGVVKKTKRYRMVKNHDRKRREYFDTYSCADYLNWVYFSDEAYKSEAFEEHLRAAVARCPDVTGNEMPEAKPKQTQKQKPSAGSMGDIGKLKGRCARTLVNFWSEREVPEDDTIGKYLIVTLRVLKYEGLSQEVAQAWVEERLQALRHTEFSDRLTDNFGESQRVMAYAVDAVWNNNGYQRDPESSDMKLKASVDAWTKKGFRLHDPSTWHNHESAVNHSLKLVWTAAILNLLPELAAVSHCNQDQAKVLLEKVLVFVQSNNELAETMVGRLLEQSGIKGRSRQKQHDVRKFFVENGLLVKKYNYYQDKATGYRHGNFYVCGLAVTFEHEVEAAQIFAATHTTTCIYCYLSSYGFNEDDWLDLVMESRRLACDERYQKRLRQRKGVFRMAA